MTGQSLLDIMEVLNPELQLQAGEANVTKGLTALNVAQDFFESLAAVRPKIFGGSIGNVTASDQTESTAFPSGLLRIDRLQVLNATTSRPDWDLRNLRRAGGHASSSYWPLNVLSTSGSGKPRGYWTDGSNIYWAPLPSGNWTVRYTGFVVASDISAAGTFAYPDVCALPLASFATRLIKMGIEDDSTEVGGLAQETFKPVLDALANFNRDGAIGLEYSEPHTT